MTRKPQNVGWMVAAMILVVDRLSKWWIVDLYELPLRHSVEVLPFFNLTMVWNRGVSFGLFSGGVIDRWILFGLVIIVVIVLAVWMRRSTALLLTLALGLIIGGALGNAADRIIYGAVADFFDVHGWGWHFWVFNVADSAISIGVGLLLQDAFFGSGRHSGKKSGEDSDPRPRSQQRREGME